MVTIQEIEARQQEISAEERKAQAVQSLPIPERRYGYGVTPQQQQEVISQRNNATQFLEEARKKRAELESIKQEIIIQEQAQRDAQEKADQFNRGRSLALNDRSPIGLGTRIEREGYRQGRAELEGARDKNKYLTELNQAKANAKANATYKDLGDGMFSYENRVFDKAGQEVFLKSGTGLTPQEQKIRDALIKSGFVKEQSTAFGLGVQPQSEVYYDQPPKTKLSAEAIREQAKYKGEGVLQSAYERARNPQIEDRYNEYNLKYRTAEIIKRRFEQVGIGFGQKILFVGEESLNFYLNLIPRQNYIDSEGNKINNKIDVRDLEQYLFSKQRRGFFTTKGDLTLTKEEDYNKRASFIDDFRNIKISNTANVLSGVGVYGSLIAGLAVSTVPGLVQGVKQTFILKETLAGYEIATRTPLVLESATGYYYNTKAVKPLTDYGIELLRPLNFLNFKNPAPAFEQLSKGINLRKVNPNSVAFEFQEYIIQEGKMTRVSDYYQYQERTPPKFKLNKNYDSVLFDSEIKAPTYSRFEPLGNKVFNEQPYIQLEFREGSRVVRARSITGQSKEFNPNLDLNQLNPAERFALRQMVEEQIGRPVSLRKGQSDKFLQLRYEGEPIVKRYDQGDKTYAGFYKHGTNEVNIAKQYRGSKLRDIFIHERTHYKQNKANLPGDELLNPKEINSDAYRSAKAKLLGRGYKPEQVSNELLAYGSQRTDELGIGSDNILRLKINESLKRIGVNIPSDKEIKAIIEGGMNIKRDNPLNFFKVKEGEMFSRGIVQSENKLKVNFNTGDITELGVPGKKLNYQSYVSRLKPFFETEEMEVYRSISQFKDVTNPNYKPRGSTPKIEAEIYIRKEPVVLSEEPVDVIMTQSKPSRSMSLMEELKTIQQQTAMPVPKSINKVPSVKVQTQAQDLEPLMSKFYGQGLYEQASMQSRSVIVRGEVGFDFTNIRETQFELSSPREIVLEFNAPVSRGTTRELTKNISKEITKELSKEISKEITRELTKELTKQTSKQVSKQITKQINKQIPKNPSRPINPSTPSKSPPINLPEIDLPEANFNNEALPGFRSFIIRGGKKVYLKGVLPRGLALKGAQGIALTTLRATFGAEPTGGYVGGEDISFKLSNDIFRDYRIINGKKVPLKDTFIQRRGKRLASAGEVREIQLSRRKR